MKLQYLDQHCSHTILIKSSHFQEGKRVHSGGGFSGKGFKFDEQEALMVNEKKKFQKAALGN